MKIKYHKRFIKHFKKRIHSDSKLDKRFEQRFKIFLSFPEDASLKDHSLIGDLKGFRSFSISGDIRVVYRIEEDCIELYDIGSHNQVY